jgi:NAD(P)-dependent dehydrogenase (short-subunit alcohol dehydrogenase family)
MTEALRLEEAENNLRVIEVAPGLVHTVAQRRKEGADQAHGAHDVDVVHELPVLVLGIRDLEALAQQTGVIAAATDLTVQEQVDALRDRVLCEQGALDAQASCGGLADPGRGPGDHGDHLASGGVRLHCVHVLRS